MDSSVNKRIKELFQFLKSKRIVRNQQDFTERIESDKATVSLILNEKINVPNGMLEKIHQAFPIYVRMEWLETGNGLMQPFNQMTDTVNKIEPFVADNLVKVRLLEIAPTASFAEFAAIPKEEYDYTYIYPISGEEIGEDDVVFSVRGDSMEPRILDKDRILGKLIRPSQWHWAKGVIILAYDNSFVIKRIIENKLDSDNYIILGSDNPCYPEKVKVSFDAIHVMYQAERIINALIK